MVTNYKPNTCRYELSKLDNIVYLIDEQSLRNIKIDNGEAYIEDISQEPMYMHCYNISLGDSETLDERYEFSHTLKFSVEGYANHNNFQGRYYAIVKTMDDEYWLINPMFPCKVTYTYTLGHEASHTDFTLSTISNFPTLRIHGMEQARPYPCKEYMLDGIDRIFINEKEYSTHSGSSIYYTNDGFKEVVYNKKSAVFTEQFDGDNVSHSIRFSIRFDDYKDSWHYNLLEFADNLYSAVITTSHGEYVLCGFGFGLQPSYTVTSDDDMTPNHIEIRMADLHDNGDLITFVSGGTISPITSMEFKFTLDYDAYECVSDGYAKYLLKKQVDAIGNPSGYYQCLEGYEDRFEFLGDKLIESAFTEVVTFFNEKCKDECRLETSLMPTTKMRPQMCVLFKLKCGSDWNISSSASYLMFTPSSGEAETEYSVEICNFRSWESDRVTTSFTINYCSTSTTYDVQIGAASCLYNGSTFNINSNAQSVMVPSDCCVSSVTESSNTLTDIMIYDDYVRIYVPQNMGESARTFTLSATMCDGASTSITINQSVGFYRWVKEDETCVGAQKCDVERMYSGVTSGDVNTKTDVTRTYNCIRSGECSGMATRWVESEDIYCLDGGGYYIEKEQIKPSVDAPWFDTGATRRGRQAASAPSCEGLVYEYQWNVADGYMCNGYNKMTREVYQRRVSGSSDTWEDVVPFEERSAMPIIEADSTDCGYVNIIKIKESFLGGVTYSGFCDGNSTLTTADTRPSGYPQSQTALTDVTIYDCITSIDDWGLNSSYVLSSVTIPNTVTSIGRYAFHSCYSLSSITIPNSVTSIGEEVFSFTGLRSITIPSTITNISRRAFASCPLLNSITIQNGVTSITEFAFSSSNLSNSTPPSTITIPSSVTYIGGAAFWACGISAFTMTSLVPPTLGVSSNPFYSLVFRPCKGNADYDDWHGGTYSDIDFVIYVPSAALNDYKTAQYWSDYADKIQAIP